jgi:hypothetical protein
MMALILLICMLTAVLAITAMVARSFWRRQLHRHGMLDNRPTLSGEVCKSLDEKLAMQQFLQYRERV